MRGTYTINQNRSETEAIAVGRFTNDAYIGGNVSGVVFQRKLWNVQD